MSLKITPFEIMFKYESNDIVLSDNACQSNLWSNFDTTKLEEYTRTDVVLALRVTIELLE